MFKKLFTKKEEVNEEKAIENLEAHCEELRRDLEEAVTLLSALKYGEEVARPDFLFDYEQLRAELGA